MSITPLYTIEEINAEIAQSKRDLTTARQMLRNVHSSGGTQRQSERERVDVLQKHLVWLQQQRMQLEGVTGPQSVQGRVFRG